MKKNGMIAACLLACILLTGCAGQRGGEQSPQPVETTIATATPGPSEVVYVDKSTATPVPLKPVETEVGSEPAPSPESPAAVPETPAPPPAPSIAPSPEPTVPPSGNPEPVEPEDAVVTDTAYTCTLSVSCATLSNQLTDLESDLAELVPEDGILFPATEVTFYGGENVFNVLQRELKKSKMHLEFVDTPIYHSAYIEGIGNIYEFDCGELSGWMYKVNSWFPNYGSSRYQLQDGDAIEFVYTCDFGRDVGSDGAGNGNGGGSGLSE